MKEKIKFVSRRGNAEQENKNLFFGSDLYLESELRGVDAFRLCKIFNRVMKPKDPDPIYYIYCLIDPRNLQVRYVGKTNNPKERLRAHISPHIYMRTNNLKSIWTEELKAAGLKPFMQILCKCRLSESENYEFMYYRLFAEGSSLLNKATIQKNSFIKNQYVIDYDSKDITRQFPNLVR